MKAGQLTPRDVDHVLMVESATHTGIFKSQDASFEVEALPVQPSEWTWKDRIGQPTTNKGGVENLTVNILNQEISLGPAQLLYQGVVKEEVRKSGDGVESSVLALQASAELPFIGLCPKWLTHTESSEEESMPVSDEEATEATVEQTGDGPSKD